ncbi:MAG: LysR family transcriptional regulator [Candidatus Lokiarchaeota archaeon]|nr:LysR family transcriptional regulator [Candidatus Lokiarchaeota archaeon]
MTIKINYLENFLVINEVGSFTKAADKLNISQSAISQQIDTLEKYFGTKLFNRTLRGVSLTEEGKILLKRVKVILDNLKLAKAEIIKQSKILSGNLSISTSTVPGEYILPSYFAKFRKEHSSVNFRVEINDTDKSFNKLFDGEVDLAAVGTLKNFQDDIEWIILGKEELVLAVPKDHELLKHNTLDPQEILNYSYITRESTSGTRAVSEKIFKSVGISFDDLNIICELASTESILTAVADNMGISVISSIAASIMKDAGQIEILRFPPEIQSTRNLYLIRLKDWDKNNRLIDAFWKYARSFKS